MISFFRASMLAVASTLAACAAEAPEAVQGRCAVSIVVLGVAQDAGKPQIGNHDDPAWTDESRRRLATSLGLIDRRGEAPKRWLVEATPDIAEQLYRLDRAAPAGPGLALEGVFVTHAHIGHYAGLMMLGKEAAGASHIPLFVMPRMASFITNNGPWSQLIRQENVILAIMSEGEPEALAPGLSVTPFAVPHRDEYSETVGFRIEGPERSAIFLPDIDSWEAWEADGVRIEDMIADADIAFLDATFFDGDELPGRDMSKIPHPTVAHSMARFAPLPDAEKAKIRFIHLNHTNPLHDRDSRARRDLGAAGFSAAEEGEDICL